MTARRRRRLTGLLYVAPAVIFVLIFTAIPLVGMVGMSFTNWSLITPPKFTGLTNFQQLFVDAQFWGSLGYTLKYTLFITPILIVGGYLLALLVSPNTPLRRTTRAIIFVPVVIGLGVSSLMWVWLFDPTFGLINKALADLGLIEKPIQFLGVDADVSTWSIIASVTWKVLGFGMILFVAAIQAIPSEINEATMVDGATFWQRTRRVTVPLTRRTILLVIAGEAMFVILLATTIGIAFSLAMGRLIDTYLAPFYGIESLYVADAQLFLTVLLLALALGLLAGLVPARRATRVDPVEVLREA